MTPSEIKRRYNLLKTEREGSVESKWSTIERLVAPYRGNFMQDVTSELSIPFEKTDLYDGTALQASQILAANLHGNLTSAYVKWFSLSFRSENLRDDPDAREWLESCSDIVWSTLNESNFSHEIAENYLDLTTFASTFMMEERKGTGEWDGALFQALPLKECFFEEDAEGKILRFYRRLMWTALQIEDKFGYLPEQCKEDKDPSKRHEVVFAVWKRDKAGKAAKLPPKRRLWGAMYVLGDEMLGAEQGYYHRPVSVARWAKVSESKWGHGPSHVAIYDVLALNRQEKLVLDALERVIDPPTKGTERGVLGDIDLQPGGHTVVRNMDELQPITSGTEWNVVSMERENRRAMIREYYMISRLDLKETPAMTATEVERRWQQMQKVLGPVLGRLQMELLGPIIENTFHMLWREGQLPEPPEQVRESNGELDIEFTGPLPIAQKADAAGAIERELGLAQNLAQVFGPEVLDAIDAEKALQEHARLTAVPAKVMRTRTEIDKRRRDRQAQEQKAMALQEAETSSNVLKNFSSAVKGAQGGHPQADSQAAGIAAA